jgi:hypothetical protein
MPRATRQFSLAIVLILLAAPFACAQPNPLAAANLETRWADLLSPDESKATRAMLSLASSPKETIALLKERFRPVKADAKRVAQLLTQLESSNFGIRNQAMAELEYLGKYIKGDLEKGLKTATDLESKSRIQRLLDQLPREPKADPMPPPKVRPGSSISVSNINGQVQITIDGVPLDFSKIPTPPTPPPGPPAQWVRAVRTVTVLEHLGTPEAVQLLQAIAAGEADAMPTTAARAALDRLKGENK